MKAIAIIPARSGSKGLVDKNIKLLKNKPMLAYSIEAAKESGVFETVMVSTDSEEYAEIAIKYGAEVPFLRSNETSSDQATTRDCIMEVLAKYKEMGKEYECFMILQPTSPLRTYSDIKGAFNIFELKAAKSVISVCEVDHSPRWCNTLDKNLSMNAFIKDEENDNRRQDLEVYYRLNGAIYLHDTAHYLRNEYYFDETCFAYIMDKKYSVDIDDEFDFLIADTLVSMRKNDENN